MLVPDLHHLILYCGVADDFALLCSSDYFFSAVVSVCRDVE